MPEVGLYNYKARWYSATMGRFMPTDPIGYKDNVNLYAYVGDDPVDKLDYTGDDEIDAFRPIALPVLSLIADHEAEYVRSDKTGWGYVSKDGGSSGISGSSKYTISPIGTFKDTKAVQADTGKKGFVQAFDHSATAKQDAANMTAASTAAKTDYSLTGANCGQTVGAGEKAAGTHGDQGRNTNPAATRAYEGSA